MDAIEAIRERRMLPRVGERRPDRSRIEELLDLAVRAPNHHLTNPWRFRVLTGDGLDVLARAYAAEEATKRGGGPEEYLEWGRERARRAPVVIVVTCLPSEDPKVVELEEQASVAMALENLLVAAYAMGLGAMLRTGTVAYGEDLRRELALEPRETVIGLVWLGYPAGERGLTPRRPVSELTSWIGWE